MDTNLRNFAAAAGAQVPKPPRPLYDVWKERARARQQQELGGVELMLPSGMPVRVRRIPLILMLQRGTIPDALTPIVNRYIAQITEEETKGLSQDELLARSQKQVSEDVESDPVEAYNTYTAIIDFVFKTAVVEPRFFYRNEVAGVDSLQEMREILPAGQDDPLFLDFGPNGEYPDVDYADRMFVYQFCQGVDQTIEEFFRQQANDLGVLSDRQDLPLSAEGTLRVDELQRQLVGVPDRPSRVGVGDLYRGEDEGDQGSASQAPTAAQYGDRSQVQRQTNQQDAGRRLGKRKRKGRGSR